MGVLIGPTKGSSHNGGVKHRNALCGGPNTNKNKNKTTKMPREIAIA